MTRISNLAMLPHIWSYMGVLHDNSHVISNMHFLGSPKNRHIRYYMTHQPCNIEYGGFGEWRNGLNGRRFFTLFSGESCNGIFDITWWGVSCRIEYTYVYSILHTHISHIISNMKKTRIRYYMCIFDYTVPCHVISNLCVLRTIFAYVNLILHTCVRHVKSNIHADNRIYRYSILAATDRSVGPQIVIPLVRVERIFWGS
jgi:hypothetical protein